MDLTKFSEAANAVLTALLSSPGILVWAKSLKQHEGSTDKLLLQVAKNQLVEQGHKYLKRRYITMDEYEEYEAEYKVYSALGGNGLARRVFEQVDELPMMPNDIDRRNER